jgi:hypothetical protein
VKPKLDIPGVVLVSGGVFCLVYGFSNAATHSWHTPSTYGFLAAGVLLLVGFAAWQGRAAHPLLPPRVVPDRNRGGAYLSMFIAAAGLFGIFLFLTYYLQQTLAYSPLVTGFAVLPMSVGLIVMANLSTIVLMPRFGPKPLVASGMLAASGGAAWLAQLGEHAGYAGGLLGPLILAGVGVGMVIAPVINTDDTAAGDLVPELIRTGGYEPVRVGGLDQSIRIEMFGDLHEYGALGRVVTKSEALAAI